MQPTSKFRSGPANSRPNLWGKTDPAVAHAVNEAFRRLDHNDAATKELVGKGFISADDAEQRYGPANMRRLLMSGSPYALDVTSMLGKLAQPQPGGAATGTATPALSNPLSQNGAIFILTPTNTLYYFNGTSAPGAWTAVAATGVIQFGTRASKPAAGHSGYTYFETDTGWTYYDNGTNYLYQSGVDIGTDATRATITVGTNDNNALFYTTDTQRLWRVSGGAWTQADVQGAITSNTTPVTVNANSTGDQNLMSYSVPAKLLNVVGNSMRVTCAGVYTTQAAETPTLTFKVKLGGTTITSWTSGNSIAASTNDPWEVSTLLTTVTTGATGTVEAHGKLDVVLSATATAASTAYPDTNTAASGAIDLTAAATLQITVAFSTQPALAPRNAATQRHMVVELLG